MNYYVSPEYPSGSSELEVNGRREASKSSPWYVHLNPITTVFWKCHDRGPGDRRRSNLQFLGDLDQPPTEKHCLIWLAKLREQNWDELDGHLEC